MAHHHALDVLVCVTQHTSAQLSNLLVELDVV